MRILAFIAFLVIIVAQGLVHIPLALSPRLLGILIGFFVITALIPYLIGAQRAKQWRTSLLLKRKDWMAKLQDILETPVGSVYLPKMAELQQSLGDEIERFAVSDPMISESIKIDQGAIPEEIATMAPAYQLVRDEDPRFKHLDLLREMSQKISEIRTDLGKLATEPELEKAALEWTTYLQHHQENLSLELGQAATTRTPATLILSGVLIPIFGVVLSKFAEWLWAYFSRSLAP